MKEKAWYSWKGNQVSWESSTWIVYIIFAFTIALSILMWIYGQKLRLIFGEKQRFFKNKISRATLFRIFGTIILSIITIKFLMLVFQDWPWKWEFLHLHLCRTFIIVVGFLFLFNKIEKIKYINFFAIFGAVLGILFSNAKITPEFQADERNYFGYLENTPEWINAGFTWGWDNFYFYEFLFIHNVLILATVFMSVVSGKKSQVNSIVFYRSVLFMLIGVILIFFANWGMNAWSKTFSKANQVAWNANWLYLGKDGINTLGKYTKWPFALLTLPIAFLLITHIMFIAYTYLTSFEFYFDNYYSFKIKVRKKGFKTNFKSLILPKKYFFNFYTID